MITDLERPARPSGSKRKLETIDYNPSCLGRNPQPHHAYRPQGRFLRGPSLWKAYGLQKLCPAHRVLACQSRAISTSSVHNFCNHVATHLHREPHHPINPRHATATTIATFAQHRRPRHPKEASRQPNTFHTVKCMSLIHCTPAPKSISMLSMPLQEKNIQITETEELQCLPLAKDRCLGREAQRS